MKYYDVIWVMIMPKKAKKAAKAAKKSTASKAKAKKPNVCEFC